MVIIVLRKILFYIKFNLKKNYNIQVRIDKLALIQKRKKNDSGFYQHKFNFGIITLHICLSSLGLTNIKITPEKGCPSCLCLSKQI